MTLLWVDDERPAPDGWFWAKTSDEALDILQYDVSNVTEVSLDFVLMGDDIMPVAYWLRDHPGPIVHYHSSSYGGRELLRTIIEGK